MQEISEADIRRLVDLFYAKVRKDSALGPIFERAIGDNWDRHLSTMVDFWHSVMLTSGRYKGNPVSVHQRVEGIAPDLFPLWLALFIETVPEVFSGDIAEVFELKARRIADSLQRAIYYRPEFDTGRAGGALGAKSTAG